MRHVFKFSALATCAVILQGCANYSTFGPQAEDGTPSARIFLMGHKGTPPISAMLKLKLIDGKDAWSATTTGYDIKPGKHTLHYKLVYVTPGKNGSEIANLLVHPYKIEADLQSGFAYNSRLSSETSPGKQICLYGEPLGAPGQRVRDVAFMSPNATLVACGTIDMSITYDSIW